MITSIRSLRPDLHACSPRALTLLPQINPLPSTYRTLTSSTKPKLISKAKPKPSDHNYYRGKRLPAESLRILFCGSDAFSAQSLAYLNEARLATQARRTGASVGIWSDRGLETVKVGVEDQVIRDEERGGGEAVDIDSIDVVVKNVKAVGRGRTGNNETPVEKMAKSMGLRVHHIDTFTGWEPPRNVNLVIAVSFGLLVPPRILKAAKFGGLNIHPSLLPDLRGPAPIHHAILNGYTHTGVTVQTLHPSKFDHGTILSQTARGKLYELSPDDTMSLHYRNLGTRGQKALQRVLEHGTYRLEHVLTNDDDGEGNKKKKKKKKEVVNWRGDKAGWYEDVVELEGGVVNLAPKVDKRDMSVIWFGGEITKPWLGTHWERAIRVFGQVWTILMEGPVKKETKKLKVNHVRVIFHDAKVVDAARMAELTRQAGSVWKGDARSNVEKGGIRQDDKNGDVQKDVREEGSLQRTREEEVTPFCSGYLYPADPVKKGGRMIPMRIIGEAVYFWIEDGSKWVEVREVTVAGRPRRPAPIALGSGFIFDSPRREGGAEGVEEEEEVKTTGGPRSE